MRKLAAIGVLCVAMPIVAQAAMSSQQQLSYALGASLGKNLKLQSTSLDLNSFVAGLEDAYQGKSLQISPDQMTTIMDNFRQAKLAKNQSQAQSQASMNLQAATQFLIQNAKQPGVKTLSNGIQYKVIQPGNGASPTKDSVVTVDYSGSLLSGKVFDSSYERGEPATFPLSAVIQGWQDTIPLMQTGATWEIYIPSQYAYGAQGVPGTIGPNEMLIFKVHLISVK